MKRNQMRSKTLFIAYIKRIHYVFMKLTLNVWGGYAVRNNSVATNIG